MLGLPVHPLLVHATVVLLPLLAVAVAAVAWLRTAPRIALGVTVAAAVMTALTWLTAESGEALEHRVAETDLVETHAEMGEKMPLFAAALLLTALVTWWLARRAVADHGRGTGATGDRDRRPGGVAARLPRAWAVVASLVALGVVIWTLRVGHSGAESVWSGVPGLS